MARLKITQIRSTIEKPENQKRTMEALGLRRMHRSVIHNDTPSIKGMIRAVSHMVKVEEVK